MRSRTTVGGLVAILLLLGTVGAHPAAAQQDQRFAVVEIAALRRPGNSRLAPVEVSVVSQRAIEASLLITHPRENLEWRFDLAIPANSEVSEVFLAPSLRGLDMEAKLFVDGEEVDSSRLDGFALNRSANAVGVFALDAQAGEIPLNPPIGQATIIPIDDLTLINGLDSVVTNAGGLGLLSDTELDELVSWVSTGRQLIVAGEPGSIDRFVPWTQPTSVVWADAGIIRYVGNDWQTKVAPGITSAGEQWQLFQMNNFGPGLGHQEILSDAGFRIPGLGPLAGLLLVYIAVVGPIAFFVLRSRREQKMLWIAIPVISALFTFGVLGAGGLLNRGRSDAHATIVEVTPAGRYVTESFVLSDDGEQNLDLPSGWQVLSTTLTGGWFGDFGAGSAVEITPTRTNSTLGFDIDPGSAGTATVTGFDASSGAGLIVTDPKYQDGLVEATLVNDSGADLVEVVAMVGDTLVAVGELNNGESASVEIGAGARNGVNQPEIREWDLNSWIDWRGVDLDNPAVSDGPVNGSAWLDWRAAHVGTATPGGTVTAIGWTRSDDGVIVGGRGRTAFVGRGVVNDVDGPVEAGMIRSIPVGSPALFGEFEDSGDRVHQVLRPSGADTSELAFSVPAGVAEVSVWTEDGFRVFDITERNVQTVRFPDLWVDDTMWIRTRNNQFGRDGSVQLVVLPVTDRTLDPELLEPGRRSERAVFEDEFGPGFQGVFETITLDPGGAEFIAEGFIEMGIDQYEFEVAEGDVISAQVSSLERGNGFGQVAPRVDLVDPRGVVVVTAVSNLGEIGSAVYTAEEDGWYRAEISLDSFDGPPFGEYELILSVQEGDTP